MERKEGEIAHEEKGPLPRLNGLRFTTNQATALREDMSEAEMPKCPAPLTSG